ncbi:CHAT domain-containing protein [Algoriphagus sp.]|uniref:CHAT domain-containing protein n=1 Tax=Algoriphagus sp. TaxID=1872435 RepID=UPI00262DF53E|nr:CHAT domain-containing protein [Algoriphagus sp.]
MKILSLIFALLISAKISAQQNEILPIIQEADSLYLTKSFDLAARKWKEVLQLVPLNDSNTSLYKSKLNFCQGKLLDQEGSYSQAVLSYQKALALIEAKGMSIESSYKIDIYNALYHSLAYSGDWEQALSIGKKGLPFFDESIDQRVQADYIYDLGYINDQLEKNGEAIELYLQSISRYKEMEENMHFDLGLAYHNLGTVYRRVEFFSERLRSLEQAKFHWEQDSTINPSYLYTLYGNLMKLYIEYGDKKKAEDSFKSITKLAAKNHPTSIQANEHRLKIIYFTFTHQNDKAQQEIQDFDRLFQNLPLDQKQVFSDHYLAALIEIGDHFISQDLLNQAEQYLSEALVLSQRFKQPYFRMLTYTKLAKIAVNKDENSVAISHLQKAMSSRNETEIGTVNEVNILIKLATLQAEEGLVQPANQSITEALSLIGGEPLLAPKALTRDTFEKQHSSYFITALRDAAEFYQIQYHLSKDLTNLENANHLFELSAQVFSLYYQNGEYNPQLNQLNKSITEGIYRTHRWLNKPLSSELISLIEENNSQVLRNEFERKHLQFLNVTEQTLAQRNLLELKLNTLEDQDSSSIQLLQDSLGQIDQKIAEEAPLYFSFYQQKIGLQQIQDQLDSDQLILKYFIGLDQSYALSISNSSIGLVELGQTDSIRKNLEAYYRLVQNPKKNPNSNSPALSAQLISPFSEELKKYKSVTIIPDDFLHYLPFEVLQTDQNLFIQSHTIQYANSLALWLLIKNSKPKTDSDKKLLAAYAPRYPTTDQTKTSPRANRFQDIAGATAEATSIGKSIQGDLYLDQEASIANFVELTTSYQIYHLAMHAVLDEQDPEQSGLVFQNNEYLDFSSLYSLSFPAELVVLSACNTGIGKLAAGEGLLSLSRALTYSGVRSSVYSLWEVPDQETSEIMIDFYNHLQRGKDKATALADAKKDFLQKNPLKSHPYYWAGFVINGDTSPIQSQALPFHWYLIILLILITGFAIIQFKKRGLSI